MKITIEEKEFEIDVERAKELSICKEVKKIKEIKAGDVFESDGSRVMIIQPLYGIGKFNIVGINGLKPYSDFEDLQTQEEMIELFNSEGYTFIANINYDIAELIRTA